MRPTLITELRYLHDQDETGREHTLWSQAADALEAEQALADDIMDVLAHMVVGWEDRLGVDLAQHPEVLRVAARYREARGR
jgi:hypothetical protein